MDRKQIVERLRDAVRKFDDIRSDVINAALSSSEAVARSRDCDMVESAMSAAADLIEADEWVSVGEWLPEHGRVIIFSPHYPAGDAMRHRILDADMVRIMVDATHWRPLSTPPGGDHD